MDDEILLQQDWPILIEKLSTLTTKKPDLKGVLFLIGVQELGTGPRQFSKEEKQDLMHIAICKVLSLSGYYKLVGLDKEGWPHWETVKKLPFLDILSQENFLKIHIIRYFKEEINL